MGVAQLADGDGSRETPEESIRAQNHRSRRNLRSGSAAPSGRRARSSERAARRSSPRSSTSGVVAKAKVQRRRGTFHSFDFFGDACRLVGGIHQPKLVEAHGSDEPGLPPAAQSRSPFRGLRRER